MNQEQKLKAFLMEKTSEIFRSGMQEALNLILRGVRMGLTHEEAVECVLKIVSPKGKEEANGHKNQSENAANSVLS